MKKENNKINSKTESVLQWFCIAMVILLILLLALMPVWRKKFNESKQFTNNVIHNSNDQTNEINPQKELEHFEQTSNGIKVSSITINEEEGSTFITAKVENTTNEAITFSTLKFRLFDDNETQILAYDVIMDKIEANSSRKIQTLAEIEKSKINRVTVEAVINDAEMNPPVDENQADVTNLNEMP